MTRGVNVPDPDGSQAFVCVLSAKFGLGDARSVLPLNGRRSA